MTDELTDAQRQELRQDLETLIDSLDQTLTALDAGAQVVDLETPIGRLSRMDALQQQSMAKANKKSMELRIKKAQAALSRIADDDDYGFCRACDEPIAYLRLKARPETPYCIACQSAAEER